jgi:hypothetical protein
MPLGGQWVHVYRDLIFGKAMPELVVSIFWQAGHYGSQPTRWSRWTKLVLALVL